MENKTLNILPCDGEAQYYGKVFSDGKSDDYYDQLLKECSWRQDEAIIFGRKYVTKRKVAWYGDSDFSYTYSGIRKVALPWTPNLLQLRKEISALTGEEFNSCLLNLYHDGSEGMAWHSDAEKQLKRDAAIASVSFGAERKFSFKHKKTGQRIDIRLEHGSLLLMRGPVQQHWLHRLPPVRNVPEPRINLTFRYIATEIK